MVNKGNINQITPPKNHAKLSAAKITPNFRPKKSRPNFPHAKRKIRILHKNNMSQKFATLSKFKVFL